MRKILIILLFIPVLLKAQSPTPINALWVKTYGKVGTYLQVGDTITCDSIRVQNKWLSANLEFGADSSVFKTTSAFKLDTASSINTGTLTPYKYNQFNAKLDAGDTLNLSDRIDTKIALTDTTIKIPGIKQFKDSIAAHLARINSKEDSLPATPTSPETKYLNGNRSWATISVGSGGYAANLYFTRTTSTIYNQYKQTSYIPESTDTVYSGTANSGTGDVLFYTGLYESPIDETLYPSGLWMFNFYGYVSSNAGSTRLKFEYFKRSISGTETTLFSSYSYDIDDLTNNYIKWETTQPIFTLGSLDSVYRMGVRLYVNSTSGSNKTIFITVGDGYASYFNTPNRLRHNQLRAFNQDTAYLHHTYTQENYWNNKLNLSDTTIKIPGIKQFKDSLSSIRTTVNNKQNSLGNINGIVKGNGSGTYSAAVVGTDYLTGTGTSGRLAIWGPSGITENSNLSVINNQIASSAPNLNMLTADYVAAAPVTQATEIYKGFLAYGQPSNGTNADRKSPSYSTYASVTYNSARKAHVFEWFGTGVQNTEYGNLLFRYTGDGGVTQRNVMSLIGSTSSATTAVNLLGSTSLLFGGTGTGSDWIQSHFTDGTDFFTKPRVNNRWNIQDASGVDYFTFNGTDKAIALARNSELRWRNTFGSNTTNDTKIYGTSNGLLASRYTGSAWDSLARFGASSNWFKNAVYAGGLTSGYKLMTKDSVNAAISFALTGKLSYVGAYDASTNLWPSTGVSGGAIKKGDWWSISVGGTLGGVTVTTDNQIYALADNPGQTASNWDITGNTTVIPIGRYGGESGLGFLNYNGLTLKTGAFSATGNTPTNTGNRIEYNGSFAAGQILGNSVYIQGNGQMNFFNSAYPLDVSLTGGTYIQRWYNSLSNLRAYIKLNGDFYTEGKLTANGGADFGQNTGTGSCVNLQNNNKGNGYVVSNNNIGNAILIGNNGDYGRGIKILNPSRAVGIEIFLNSPTGYENSDSAIIVKDKNGGILFRLDSAGRIHNDPPHYRGWFADSSISISLTQNTWYQITNQTYKTSWPLTMSTGFTDSGDTIICGTGSDGHYVLNWEINIQGVDSKVYQYRMQHKRGATTTTIWQFEVESAGKTTLRPIESTVALVAGDRVWVELRSTSAAPGSVTIKGGQWKSWLIHQ